VSSSFCPRRAGDTPFAVRPATRQPCRTVGEASPSSVSVATSGIVRASAPLEATIVLKQPSTPVAACQDFGPPLTWRVCARVDFAVGNRISQPGYRRFGLVVALGGEPVLIWQPARMCGCSAGWFALGCRLGSAGGHRVARSRTCNVISRTCADSRAGWAVPDE
jgi:hypothetical protein